MDCERSVAIAVSTDLIALRGLFSDGASGAMISVEDDRSFATTGPDIYAQRVTAAGSVVWAIAGGAVVLARPPIRSPVSISLPDGAGGINRDLARIFAGNSNDVYAQKLDASGHTTWTVTG